MKITKSLGAVLCLGLPLGLFAQKDNVRMGEVQYEQGDYEKALEFYNKSFE